MFRLRTLVYGLFSTFLLLAVPYVYAQTASPHLSFTPATKSESVGGSFDVSVNVDTGTKSVDSVDAIIEYDPNLLTVVSVAKGTFFPTVTNNITTLGKIKIYGIADTGKPKTGTGVLATITFKGKDKGTAAVDFVCQSGSTTDSNINQGSVDVIVCSANGSGSYTISAAATATQSSSQATAGAIPKTGAVEPTILLLGVGMVLSTVGAGLFIPKRLG